MADDTTGDLVGEDGKIVVPDEITDAIRTLIRWSLMLMALTGVWLGLATRWQFWWTKASLAAGTLVFAIFYWVQK